MEIRQGNLTLRDASPADAAALGAWWRDGQVMAHAGFPLGLTVTDNEIAASLQSNPSKTGCLMIIEMDHEPIGEMNYRDLGQATAQIGIKICAAPRQNQGIGTTLLRTLINELFFCRGYEKIILDTNLSNTRAQHVYEKIGFRKTQVRLDAWTDQLGRAQSAVDYELTKRDYPHPPVTLRSPSGHPPVTLRSVNSCLRRCRIPVILCDTTSLSKEKTINVFIPP